MDVASATAIPTRRPLLNQVGARLAQRLVRSQRGRHVGHAQAHGQADCVLDGLVAALGQERQHRVGRVTEDDDPPTTPGGQGRTVRK